MSLLRCGTRARPTRRPRLEVEAVEGRTLLSTLFVSTTGFHLGQHAVTSIQSAVNAAKPGDTIDVGPGTYHESVFVGKPLTLLGAQSGVNPITGLRTNPANESTVTKIGVGSTSHVRIDGFTLNNNASNNNGGFALVDQTSQGDTITNNIVLPGANDGVLVFEGSLTTLSNNEIESPQNDGIAVQSSPSLPLTDTIQGNEIFNSGVNGIDLAGAVGVVVKGNSPSGSKGEGLFVRQSTDVNAANNLVFANNVGVTFVDSSSNTIQGNTVEFNKFEGIVAVRDQGDVILANSVFGNATSGVGSAILLDNASGGEAVENNSVLQNRSNGIEVDFSTNVKVSGNTVENNGGDGIGLNNTTDSIVAGNFLTGNAVGLHLVSSSSNQFIGNIAEYNKGDGILLDAKSVGNTLSKNTALNNGAFDAEDDSTGTGTAGTANFWIQNTEKKDNRGGGLGH
jgi:parallel beta-helix repeat protein